MGNGIDVHAHVTERNGGGDAIGMSDEPCDVDPEEMLRVRIGVDDDLTHLLGEIVGP